MIVPANTFIATAAATLLIAYRFGLKFEDIFFLDVTSTITGTGALLIMIQPILNPIWIGIGVGKSMTLK